jgi:hypothetical protein
LPGQKSRGSPTGGGARHRANDKKKREYRQGKPQAEAKFPLCRQMRALLVRTRTAQADDKALKAGRTLRVLESYLNLTLAYKPDKINSRM